MKAQSYFGGTNPKDHASKVKQVGISGTHYPKTTHIAPKVTVKQVGTTRYDGSNNHQMHRDPSFKTKGIDSVGRPAGKEDNRGGK